MATLDFSTPLYFAQPQNFRESLSNVVEGFFEWNGTRACVIDPKQHLVRLEPVANSFLMRVLKVVLYATLLIPAIMLAIKACLRAGTAYRFEAQISPPLLKSIPDPIQQVLNITPPFAGYKIGQGSTRASLTAMSLRPANLFYRALFGLDATTLPGGPLFAFHSPHADIKNLIANADPNGVVAFSAQGVPGSIHRRGVPVQQVPDLGVIYGNGTYRISYGELQSTLNSQKIYTAPLLPLPFYRALKAAMQQDGIVILPAVRVNDMPSPHCQALLHQVRNNFPAFGFKSAQHTQDILGLTLYQLGSLVVKSEDYRIFMDSSGKIFERQPGAKDAIRLINACGIRDFHSTPADVNRMIMTQTFQTAFVATEGGMVVFPAVGMGVWRGDPDLYWRAFFDAVVTSGNACEQIFVNPGHQTTLLGPYTGHQGQEFQLILNAYRVHYAQNPAALANLDKIVNLYDRQTDLVQLSYQLKKDFPEKSVSLFNASDPDVTLGYHVGEYVNNLDHATTTEENYTAMGTNGLCFETITGVHQDLARLIGLR